MIVNLVNYIKSSFFCDIKIDKKYCIVSDIDIDNKNFYRMNSLEPVGQILALKEKYNYVFVVLDTMNWDNIYRLYKYNLEGICILNLNSGYTGIGKKIISPDLDDIYIKSHISIFEPMDKENFLFYINYFLSSNLFTHIRVPNKELEEKIGLLDFNMDYNSIINFDQFGISGYSGLILSYGSMLQESINVANLLQSEGLNMDMFWIGEFKKDFPLDLIDALENQDKVFIIGDFSDIDFKEFIYSKFYDSGIIKEDVYFICPENINKLVVQDYLGESTKMDSMSIYKRIRNKI